MRRCAIPTLTALAVYSAYKLISNYIKSKKAKRMDEGVHSMNKTKLNPPSNIYKSTSYNALCGVIGNAIYDFGKRDASIKSLTRRSGGLLLSGAV